MSEESNRINLVEGFATHFKMHKDAKCTIMTRNLKKTYRVSQKNCSTFDKILKNKDNVNKLMET